MNTPHLPPDAPASAASSDTAPLQGTPTLPQPLPPASPTAKALTPVLPDVLSGTDAPVFQAGPDGLDFAAASHMGSYHGENEDSHTATPPQPLWLAVVDGVGGGALGRLASQTLLERLGNLDPAILPDAAQRRGWLHQADTDVAMALAEHTRQPGAATFVAAWPDGKQHRWLRPSRNWQWWRLTWAGDCRAYRLSVRGELHLLTRDDTYGNLNEIPPSGSGRDDPARMVGSGAVDEANYARIRLKAGEMLFLCSDGLHKHVPPDQLIGVLQETGSSLSERCTRLCRMAHQNGGKDDATIVAVQRQPFRLATLWRGVLLGVLFGVLLMGYRFYSQPRPVLRPVPVTLPATPPLPVGMAADAAVPPVQAAGGMTPAAPVAAANAKPPVTAPAPVAPADHLPPPPVRAVGQGKVAPHVPRTEKGSGQ